MQDDHIAEPKASTHTSGPDRSMPPLDGWLPPLGLGVFDMTAREVDAAVSAALECGYRLFDTAAVYGNETALGRALRTSGLSEQEYTVVTKVWNTASRSSGSVVVAAEESRERLGMDQIGLLLIHWPVSREGRYIQAWEALLHCQDRGIAARVGVSNFLPEHLDALAAAGLPTPAVNQIERHPLHAQHRVHAANGRHGTLTMAWSPLGRGLLDGHPVVTAIAERHGATPAQVLLRWNLDAGVCVIPKSANPGRIAANARLGGLRLTSDDSAQLDALDVGHSIDRTLYERFQ